VLLRKEEEGREMTRGVAVAESMRMSLAMSDGVSVIEIGNDGDNRG
jgi:hypothetical protein